MPAAYTHQLSVQVLDFEDIRLLIQLARLICDFCSSGQRFACGFLQIPPRDGHPCRSANDSPCRVRRRLSLPSECALPGAQKKEGRLRRSGPTLDFDFRPRGQTRSPFGVLLCVVQNGLCRSYRQDLLQEPQNIPGQAGASGQLHRPE